MIRSTITIDGGKKLDKLLANLANKQVRFAVAKSLTVTAQDAQAAVLSDLPKKYTLRGKWYQPRNYMGIKITMANYKRELTSAVHTRADWMVLHETGGIKRPDGRHLAIPTSAVRRTSTGKIRTDQRPRNLFDKKAGAFISDTRGGPAIFLKVRGVARAMYWLEPRGRIRKSFGFHDTTEKIVRRRWVANFRMALRDAIRSSR